jgi:two-component system invasion response regulator UvrY
MNVLVCDDHPVVRRGLKNILLADGCVATVGEASRATELLSLVRSRPWDVVVLDIGLPGLNGLEALRQLKQERPRLPVLILSVHPADHYAIRSLRAGAAGYLSKEAAPEELLNALRVVVSGRKYVTSEVAQQLALDLEHPSDRLPHEALSDREYQILCLLASGETVTKVAADLALSVKTVSTHRVRMLKKLGLKTNADIIRYALQQRLVS